MSASGQPRHSGYFNRILPEPEDKQLLRNGSAEQYFNGAGPNASGPAWKQLFSKKPLTNAALVVCLSCMLEVKARKLTDRCTAPFQVAPLWFGAQLAFNFSLSLTNVTSNTILSSTSGLFTYGLSCLLLGEAYTLKKLLSILICIAGETS